MSKKVKAFSSSSSDDDFQVDSSFSSTAFSQEQAAGYFLIGGAVSSLPAYLYSSVFDLSFTDYGVIYLLVLLLTAGLLTLAYRTLEAGTLVQLLNMRKQSKKTGGNEANSAAKTAQEAQAWSFFVANLLYSALFLFLAFYVLKQVDTPYNYALSSVAAAGITWQVAVATTK